MESAIHMNGASPFTCIEPFMTNTNAFTMPTHVSGCPPIRRVDREQEQGCPQLEGDSYSIETESGTWYTDEGNFETFDLTMQVYCQSEQNRNLLVHFLEEAVERYCAIVVARSQNDSSTTIAAVA